MAWSQSPAQLPIYGTGLNVIPTIHITDLANIIINVVESKPEQRCDRCCRESDLLSLCAPVVLFTLMNTGTQH